MADDMTTMHNCSRGHSLTPAELEARFHHFGGNIKAVMDGGRPMDLGLRLMMKCSSSSSWREASELLQRNSCATVPKGWGELVHMNGLPPDYRQYELIFASRFVARTIVGRAWLEADADIAGWLAKQQQQAEEVPQQNRWWGASRTAREQVEEAFVFCRCQLQQELLDALPRVLAALVITYIRRP